MRISQKLDYAQRAVLQLAKCYDGKTVSRLDDISEREAIPSSFLVQILADLRKAGIVQSKRGKLGGYLLAVPPAEISLASVIEAVEPQLVEEPAEFEGGSGPVLSRAWKELSASFLERVKKVTYEDLLSSDNQPMWFI